MELCSHAYQTHQRIWGYTVYGWQYFTAGHWSSDLVRNYRSPPVSFKPEIITDFMHTKRVSESREKTLFGQPTEEWYISHMSLAALSRISQRCVCLRFLCNFKCEIAPWGAFSEGWFKNRNWRFYKLWLRFAVHAVMTISNNLLCNGSSNQYLEQNRN